MKFSNFLFPTVARPDEDSRAIDETLREARLCDALGMEAVWLAEHHFDGMCAYVDPVSFAAAIAASTERIKIGFAVAQLSLHHPVRLAEQLSLIDNISRGRLLVGLGRGASYHTYEYEGYGIDPDEAQARLVEAEEIMLKAWTTPELVHEGRFWNVRIPQLRPCPFTKPHPYIIRASMSESSLAELARSGRPFLMNAQPNDITAARIDLYRETMAAHGYDDAAIAANLDQTWIWRYVYVADTDEEAARVGIPALEEQTALRFRMHDDPFVQAAGGASKPPHKVSRDLIRQTLIHGDPGRVAEEIATLARMGIGGLIIGFRLGTMHYEVAERSIRLFMSEVAPRFAETPTPESWLAS